MQSLESVLFPIVRNINTYLSDYILVFLLLGVGLWYSVQTRFVQIRCFGEGMRRMFGSLSLNGKKHDSGMSSFQALATAVAAQVGTGNVIGAASAILIGGPGAIFWMWITAFLGMATIYAEAVLALETRRVDEKGNVYGGPAYYIKKAFTGSFGSFLADFFSVAIIFALGFMGCMVQSNSIGSTMESAFGIPSWVMGAVLVLACGFVFIGGVQRLASVVEKIVPLMAVLFIVASLVVLIVRWEYIPATFGMIFRYAFEPQAIIGGGFGEAFKIIVSQGVKRGLFSNEAGMGSTPHAHAQANVSCPHEQGVVAMIGVFMDDLVVLTLNALVIISTMYTADGPLYTGVIPANIGVANLAQNAFGSVFGYEIGSAFIAVSLLFFAFSTVLGWNLFGKINVMRIFARKRRTFVVTVYNLLALVFIFVGTCVSNDFVWELTDMFNNLMVLPNVVALFALTALVKKHLP